MTARENELLKRLQKRLDWLNTRIYKMAETKADLSFDRAEAHALEWGMAIIEKYLGVSNNVPSICHHTYALLKDNKVFCIKCLEIAELKSSGE
jgi:hypothetical protein